MEGAVRRKYGERRPRGYKIEAKVREAVNLRWSDDEIQLVRSAVAANASLDQVHALLPHRTRHSVKDQYYAARAPQDRELPAGLSDARRQKDGREGCARLLEALMRHHPELFERQRVSA